MSFCGTAYVRIGSSKAELSKYPDRARTIWARELDWPAQPCNGVGLSVLEPVTLAKARERFLERHPAQKHDIQGWDDSTFLHKTRLFRDGAATNAALLLLGRPESASLLEDGIAWLFWILKDADNRPLDSANRTSLSRCGRPRAAAHTKPARSVHAERNGDAETVRPVTTPGWFARPFTTPLRTRTTIGNAVFPWVEFPDRVIVNNAGAFLPGDVENGDPPKRTGDSLSEPLLAGAMYAFGVIESQGGGIRKMFETQRERFFPLSDYDLAEYGYVEVTIHGRLFGESYSRLLMERPDLDLEQVMLLNKVQKGLPISPKAHLELEAEGLVRGSHPHHEVTDPNLDVTAPSAHKRPRPKFRSL